MLPQFKPMQNVDIVTAVGALCRLMFRIYRCCSTTACSMQFEGICAINVAYGMHVAGHTPLQKHQVLSEFGLVITKRTHKNFGFEELWWIVSLQAESLVYVTQHWPRDSQGSGGRSCAEEGADRRSRSAHKPHRACAGDLENTASSSAVEITTPSFHRRMHRPWASVRAGGNSCLKR